MKTDVSATKPHHESWGFFWCITAIGFALVFTIFAASGVFGASWPVTVTLPEKAEAISLVQFRAVNPVGTLANCANCSTLTYTANTADNQFNQVVAYVSYEGFTQPSAIWYLWDSRTIFSATEQVQLHGFRWSEPVDSVQLFGIRDLSDTLFKARRGNTAYRYDTTVTVYAGHYHKFVLRKFYDGFAAPSFDEVEIDMRDTSVGGFQWPHTPGLVTLFLQYSRNGAPYKGATLTVANSSIATDTSTGQVIGPFLKSDRTDSLGVVGIQLVPSPFYHDSLKSLYDISLAVKGHNVKLWPDFYIPNQDTIRITVED